MLREGVTELRSWTEPEHEPARLFVDAASTPSRVAAVLVIDGEILFTDAVPHPGIMKCLSKRGDKQITSLARRFHLSRGVSTCLCALAAGDHGSNAWSVYIRRLFSKQKGGTLL